MSQKCNSPLTVVTYNVHGCRGLGSQHSTERIAKVLSTLNPDLVALQEVDVNRSRSGYTHQPERIADELDMHWHFYSPPEWPDGQYGCAILSKYPMMLIRAENLPKHRHHETRSAVWVQLELPGGPVSFVNTHLGLRPEEKAAQIRTLLSDQWLGGHCVAHPMILCGDFNFTRRNPLYRAVTEKFRNAQAISPNRFSIPTFMGLRTLDYIFVTDPIKVIRAATSFSLNAILASDHFPVVAHLSI